MNLVDSITQRRYSVDLPIWSSPEGNLLDLEFHTQFPIEKIKQRSSNLWRYREAIPILEDANLITMHEGFTPLIPISLVGKNVWVKQEQLFSTGSYKDRGATVLISKAKELGITKVVQDSSGNAGCAIAAYAALAKMSCTIFLQNNTSPSKVAQMKSYGATINYIEGSREDVAEATLKAAQTEYYASHSWNSFFMHGTKTFAYEVCEQLGWKVPDSIILPAGNGTLILGCYIGFMDLLKAGVIDKMPKLIAIQSAHCDPLTQAFNQQKNTYDVISSTPTLAEGIAIAKPIRGNQMLEAVIKTKGLFLSVTDEALIEAWKYCASLGFYIEPTSAATIAGAIKYIKGYEDETIVTLFSGHGLKSTDSIKKMILPA